jgi:putative ABC transport system substrate-binding protein
LQHVGRHAETAFRQGLKEAGFVEGQNVAIEYRYAENQPDRLPALVAELIRRPVAVIVGNVAPALAAKAATTTVPIVFVTGSDPVQDGLVTSLNRPDGNITGVVFITGVLGSKRLELLRQIVPQTTKIAMLVFPNTSETEAERAEIKSVAQATGQQIDFLDVRNNNDIETAFATLVSRGAGAVLCGSGGFMFNVREQIIALASRHKIPTISTSREAALAGGLMSYGTSITEAYRQAGIYAARILKGEKPADLPVMQSTKFEFVLNLKTAKELGLAVPDRLLALADEVIE